MQNRALIAASIVAALTISSTPALAAIIIITQAKANAGGITPADTAGFPVTLSVPGAYRLDTNLTVPLGKVGIAVRTHYVDIDMNGFRLYGWNSAGTQRLGVTGVDATFGVSKIHDGFISGFASEGIRLRGNSNQWVIENMTIQSNGTEGIDSASIGYTRVLNSTIDANGTYGILCGDYCHVEGSIVASNQIDGVLMRSGLVLGNTIAGNVAYAVNDTVTAGDIGVGNNALIGNNAGGAKQLFGTADLHPNTCSPTPCR
jgi:hypothetical protein